MFPGLQDHPSAGGRGGGHPDGEAEVDQNNSKSYNRILMEFSGNVDNEPRKRTLNIGDCVPDPPIKQPPLKSDVFAHVPA